MTEIVANQGKRKRKVKEGKKEEIVTCNNQVQSWTSGRMLSRNLINSTYQFSFPFTDSSTWWQDALGYIILRDNTGRKKCVSLFKSSTSLGKNSDYMSQCHKSIPELITEARGR